MNDSQGGPNMSVSIVVLSIDDFPLSHLVIKPILCQWFDDSGVKSH